MIVVKSMCFDGSQVTNFDKLFQRLLNKGRRSGFSREQLNQKSIGLIRENSSKVIKDLCLLFFYSVFSIIMILLLSGFLLPFLLGTAILLVSLLLRDYLIIVPQSLFIASSSFLLSKTNRGGLDEFSVITSIKSNNRMSF